MKTALVNTPTETRSINWNVTARPALLRNAEKIAVAYFVYTAVMVSLYRQPLARCVLAWTIPLVVSTVLALETRYSGSWSRVTRDWSVLGLILIAYRQVDWLGSASTPISWQEMWIGWDRYLLHDAGLSRAIGALGGLAPSVLEAFYLCLYAIPPVCMGVLYLQRRRDRIDRFLTMLFLGTMSVYALLPHFPTLSPRFAFPGQDLPEHMSVFRAINMWLLDHCDISTSVFPSGHVAVAFSCAFGLLRALPEQRWVYLSAFIAAFIVFTATIYCRYHYVADGLASILITAAGWSVTEALDRHA